MVTDEKFDDVPWVVGEQEPEAEPAKSPLPRTVRGLEEKPPPRETPKAKRKEKPKPHPWEDRVLHGSDIHFYKIEDGQKRHIVSIEALYASGCFPLILQGPERRNLGMTEADVDEILAKTPLGKPITLVPMP